MSEFNLDFSGSIDKYDTLPCGSIRVWGTIAQVGWLEYYDVAGQVRYEYVSEDVLFEKAHLDSIGGSPITLNHPPAPITPKNYKQYAVGSTGTKIVAREDLGTVEIVTVIGDEEAIEAVKSKKTYNLSMGYTANTTLIKDNLYNQSERRCNHNALVVAGRAPDAKIHIDGVDNVGTFIGKTLNDNVIVKPQIRYFHSIC